MRMFIWLLLNLGFNLFTTYTTTVTGEHCSLLFKIIGGLICVGITYVIIVYRDKDQKEITEARKYEKSKQPPVTVGDIVKLFSILFLFLLALLGIFIGLVWTAHHFLPQYSIEDCVGFFIFTGIFIIAIIFFCSLNSGTGGTYNDE